MPNGRSKGKPGGRNVNKAASAYAAQERKRRKANREKKAAKEEHA